MVHRLLDILFGIMALSVVLFRILTVGIPHFKSGVKNRDISQFVRGFLSFL
jgi:hypothetical protein